MSLALASLFLGGAVFFCVKLYWYYSSLEPSSSSDTEAPIVIYRADEIETALNDFATRKKTHDEIMSSLEDEAKSSSTKTPVATSTISIPSPEPEEQPTEPEDLILIETPTPALGGR